LLRLFDEPLALPAAILRHASLPAAQKGTLAVAKLLEGTVGIGLNFCAVSASPS
jgi:hypothetical protein